MNAFPASRPRAVIFDLDGTLYDQPRLRRRMLRELLTAVLLSPRQGLLALRILSVFRRLREDLPAKDVRNLAQTQYELAGQALKRDPEQIREVVAEWMFRRPLRHLPRCVPSGLEDVLAWLRDQAIPAGVFSDYPAQAKLDSLNMRFDLVLDAEDPRIDRLKPDPAGLLLSARLLDHAPDQCLLIGDRDDRDGEAARRAGMPCLLYTPKPKGGPGTFTSYAVLYRWLRSMGG
jgi:putative hydrolase of the HAD superfamily